jgi:NADP-dependent 3-hydroxy acid dehydrogenase YdfG
MWDPHDPNGREGFVPRSAMLRAESIADAVRYAVTRPAGVLIEELRLSPA